VNEHDQESFEMELHRLRPAKVPQAFAQRLAATRPEAAAPRPVPPTRAPQPVSWRRWRRWLAPATAAVGLVILLTRLNVPDRGTPDPAKAASGPAALRADDVEIDRQLVSTFEAVATLPGGEPVRLCCQEWMDEVILRDTARGVSIEHRTPRFEVIPVRFETF
jgi:hypothetical protein